MCFHHSSHVSLPAKSLLQSCMSVQMCLIKKTLITSTFSLYLSFFLFVFLSLSPTISPLIHLMPSVLSSAPCSSFSLYPCLVPVCLCIFLCVMVLLSKPLSSFNFFAICSSPAIPLHTSHPLLLLITDPPHPAPPPIQPLHLCYLWEIFSSTLSTWPY